MGLAASPTVLGASAALAVALLASPASAPAEAAPVDGVIVSGPSAITLGYATPVAVATPGGGLQFHNVDLLRHDVVASDHFGPDDRPWCTAYPAGGCPLFWTPLVGFAGSSPVFGLEDAPAGLYPFLCREHPAMHGTLVVTDVPQEGA